ncbi:MAG: hypothetical protein Crog4KO_23380 [Crocinitomicaceae bacterium]
MRKWQTKQKRIEGLIETLSVILSRIYGKSATANGWIEAICKGNYKGGKYGDEWWDE